MCNVPYHGSAKDKLQFEDLYTRDMYIFGPKIKVSSYQKLVFRSGVGFLFLFVLTDAILLNLDLQKRTPDLIIFSNVYTFVYH